MFCTESTKNRPGLSWTARSYLQWGLELAAAVGLMAGVASLILALLATPPFSFAYTQAHLWFALWVLGGGLAMLVAGTVFGESLDKDGAPGRFVAPMAASLVILVVLCAFLLYHFHGDAPVAPSVLQQQPACAKQWLRRETTGREITQADLGMAQYYCRSVQAQTRAQPLIQQQQRAIQ